jgi:4a-hydroxytetrahydrobiopterin dehydratase
MDRDLRRMSLDDVELAAAALEGWELVEGKLAREYRFPDFVEAIGFMVRVAVWAEKLDHHPEWFNVYRTVRVELWTHDVDGITSLDLELAAKMNELAGP